MSRKKLQEIGGDESRLNGSESRPPLPYFLASTTSLAATSGALSGARGGPIRPATPSSVRAVNRSIVLNLIRLYEPVSRAQLAQRTGIFRSSVSDIVDQLVEEGLLVERHAAPRGRGRVPVMLYLNPDGFPVLGVSIQPTKTLVAVAGLTAEAHQTLFFETPQKPRDFVHKLSKTIEQLGEQHGRGTSRPFEELGVSVPGLDQPCPSRIDIVATVVLLVSFPPIPSCELTTLSLLYLRL